MSELIELEAIDVLTEKRCSDFDEDCSTVISPLICWIGDDLCGFADGYCPLLRKARGEDNE